MMIRRIILILFAVSLTMTIAAEKITIPIKGYKGNADKVEQPVKHRSPFFIPVEVTYDTDTHIVEISCTSDLEGEVYLYNASGEEEGYAPCLNAVLSVSDSQYHTILIEGDGWEATGVIE